MNEWVGEGEGRRDGLRKNRRRSLTTHKHTYQQIAVESYQFRKAAGGPFLKLIYFSTTVFSAHHVLSIAPSKLWP